MMGSDERDRFVRAGLTRSGYLPAGASNGDLATAISRYQSDNDLLPNGRADFDLLYHLLATESRKPGSSGGVGALEPAAATPIATAPAPTVEPPRAMLGTNRGPRRATAPARP